MKIRSKILIPIYAFIVLGFIILGTSLYAVIYQNNIQNGFEHLETRTILSSNKVYNFLEEITEKLVEISSFEENIRALLLLSKYQFQEQNTLYKNALTTIDGNVSHFQNIYPEIQNIIFTDQYGIVLYSIDKKVFKGVFIEGVYGQGFLGRAQQEVFISNIRLKHPESPETSHIFSSVPVYNKEKNEFLGNVIIEFNTIALDEILSAPQELGETGQTYLVGRDGIVVTNISKDTVDKFEISISDIPILNSCFTNSMDDIRQSSYKNFSGKDVMGRYKYIDVIDMCLIAEIESHEVLKTSKRVLRLLVLSCVITFLSISFLILKFIKDITSPLLYLTHKMQNIQTEGKDNFLKIETNDEIGDLTKSFQKMLEDLNVTDKKIQKKVQEQTKEIREKQKEAETLNQELIKFEEALKKASDYVAIFDKKFRVVYINKSLEKETGFLLEECIGQPAEKFWRKNEDQNKLLKIREKAESTKTSITQEIVTNRKDGTSFPSEVHLSPILDKKGKIIFYLTIENDITQEKNVKQMKDEFISLVSHELRTPMTVIGGFTKLFLEEKFGKVTEEQKKYLNRMDANIKYLIHMVNDMLDLEKLNSGKIEFHYKAFNMYELLKDIKVEMSLMCKQKDIQLSLVGQNIVLVSDMEKIREVLINLIGNAYKFTNKKGKIHLILSQPEKTQVKVEIQDTGIGIEEKHASKIFQKFGQVDSQLQKKEEGTGLGLSICQIIVKKLGGDIGFTSTYGKGSNFYFTLPIKKRSQITKK